MFHIFQDVFWDILKSAPILLAVYALLHFAETRMQTAPSALERAGQFGPVIGALAGTIPQCGFSAAASALFNAGYLAPATLIAVFIATSDEALPLLIAGAGTPGQIAGFIAYKLVLAVLAGYVLQFTVFRRARNQPRSTEFSPAHAQHVHSHGAVYSILTRTAKTILFLFVTLFLIELVMHAAGEEALASLLLSGSLLQPALCALIGLIPGCAVSVLLTELYLSGTISFGAAIAGLSTGAGFGYILLLKPRGGRRRATAVIAWTYVSAVVGGTLIQLFIG